MFENPRRGRQARNFTVTNVPKILVLKSSSEQIFSRKLPLGALAGWDTHNYTTKDTVVRHSKKIIIQCLKLQLICECSPVLLFLRSVSRLFSSECISVEADSPSFLSRKKYGFSHSVNHSTIHSIIHSVTFNHSVSQSFHHSFNHSFSHVQSFSKSVIPPFIQSFIHSFIFLESQSVSQPVSLFKF